VLGEPLLQTGVDAGQPVGRGRWHAPQASRVVQAGLAATRGSRRRLRRRLAQNGPVVVAPRRSEAPRETRPLPSGARSGALLAGASAASIVANYVFLLAAGRVLGSASYGSLAALLGLLAIVLIPAGALQMAVSREISRRIASGDVRGADDFARTAVRMSVLATVPLVALALVLAAPLADLLHIHSVGIVVLAAATLVSALVFPVAQGVIQGVQRFHALAALYIVPFAVRLPLFGIAAALGYRLGAAIVATLVGSLAATALALAAIREPLAAGEELPRAELRPFLRYLTPVAAGLVGVALLTHVDILIVKARLSADDAGAYAAASAFARVGFFLPATILAVLFPRTAARQARGEQTEDILGRSLIATIALCGALALFYAAAGVGLISASFGRSYAEGGRILAPFAVAIGFYSLAYILVGYHLSRGESRYAWIVTAGVVAQLATLALVAAHEVFVTSSVPALRAGIRQFTAGRTAQLRRVALETSLVLLGTTAFVCAFMWPVVAHLGSTITGSLGSDSTGSVAWFWTLQHETGYHLLGTTHHTMSGAPLGWDEGNGLNIQWFLPYYPGYLATKLFGPVAAYNLVTLAGYVLSGASMYLLVRYLGCARLVAVWAALVFIIFPWHIARAEHASLTHLEVLALLVLALVAATRRPTWIRFGFVGAATFACWLTSGYFGGMAVVTAVAFGLGAAVAIRRRRGLVLAAGTTGAALVASGLVAIGSYASGANAGAGIHRDASALYAYGLRPVELVVPAARHLVFGLGLDSFWARHAHGSNITEISNYLGLLTFALAIGWIVVAYRRRSSMRETRLGEVTAGLVAAFAVGFLFALPSPLGGVSMPSKWLWDRISAFRVPSRWDPLLMTVLLPLAALGLQALWQILARRRRVLGVAAVAVAIAVSFGELAVHTVPRFRTVPVPAEYAALTSTTPNGILAEYPLGYSDIYRLWQRVHDRPLVNGAPDGTTADQVRMVLLDPAEPGTAQSLSLLGVTAIAIHPGGPADVPVEPREPTRATGYRLVGRYPDGASVWDVVARPAPALVVPAGGFLAPTRTGNATIEFPLASQPGTLELRAKAPGVVMLTFATTVQGGGSTTVHIGDGNRDVAVPVAGTTPVAVSVQVPRGRSELFLRPEGSASISVSQPRADATGAEAVLSALPLTSDPGF
jgi:O-antigen/teichoic acid export membrane protein